MEIVIASDSYRPEPVVIVLRVEKNSTKSQLLAN
jgi:hypothetical protein